MLRYLTIRILGGLGFVPRETVVLVAKAAWSKGFDDGWEFAQIDQAGDVRVMMVRRADTRVLH